MLSGHGLRRGVTLIELVVAMTIGALVLGIVVMISVRQQRLYGDVAGRASVDAQLQAVESVLPIDLRSMSPAGGDLRTVEARDTSVELRATIASSVICDTVATRLVLSPANTDAALSSFITAIQAGDTAWILTPSDSVDDWLPYPVVTVGTAPGGGCARRGPVLDSVGRTLAKVSIGMTGVASLPAVIGAPVRFTRPVRYSLYRGGDGQWYLGQRDWNSGAAHFNGIQPVSGPFLSPSAHGLTLQYFDTAGVPLPVPLVDGRNVALITVSVRGRSKNPQQAFGARGMTAPSTDSTVIAVGLHNRR